MYSIVKLLVLILCILSASCSYEEMFDKLVPDEESKFAEEYLSKLRNNNISHIKKYLDPSIESQVTDEKLAEIVERFPSGDLLYTKLIGAQTHKFNSQWRGNFTFEYEFSNGWALANVVLVKLDSNISVIGFNVYSTKASQNELNRFKLVDKSLFQYLVLVFAITAPVFILITIYFCIRTPIPKRKWLWIVFILVGVGSISVNWTTGQYGIQLLSVNLFSASAVAAGPSAPWIISVSLPLGAILFWIKRKNLIGGNFERPQDDG